MLSKSNAPCTLSLIFICGFYVITSGLGSYATAQQRFQFEPNLPYDSTIESPGDFLGYQLGQQFTPHHRVIDYFSYLAGITDKITLTRYAETYEHRGLYYAVISSEKNHSEIDEIRNENRRLAQPDSLNNTMADMLMANQPVVVWLSYNVHGNEPSSSEAAMQTAYRLVAARDNQTEAMLNETVVIIDPMLNPDGRERYVGYYKTAHSKLLNTDQHDFEHDEPWPGGRTNHYWFDLNRDWTWLVHPESRGRVEAYQKWLPQVHLDLHEQGFNNNYFTMPGTTPRNHLLPGEYEAWATIFGNGAINEFDQHQVSYATREAFDFFYPGYGSSYPSLMGGIGILAEQGGHSRGGRAVETEDGYVLTLKQRIFDHYTNSIATVKTAMENRETLLSYFRTFFSTKTKKEDTKAYILPDNSKNYTYEFINILLQHGVIVERATRSFRVDEAQSYWDGEAKRKPYQPGSFIIKTDQPRHIIVNTLMKRQMTFKDSVMYDMSTWSAPMAYGLEATYTTDNVDVETERLMEPLSYPRGVDNADARYAYVIDWEQRFAPKALAELWRRDYRVRTAFKPFTKDGREYPRGSLIVLIGRNYEARDRIQRDMQEISNNAQVQIQGFDTGRMDSGMDLASRSSQPVNQPKAALLVDEPFNYYTAGQIWFLMEQWSDYGISRLRLNTFKNIALDKYEVLILPDHWGQLSTHLDSAQVDKLQNWVQAGGTLIATGNSARYLTKDRSGFTEITLVQEVDKAETDSGRIDPEAYTTYAARDDSSGLRRIPGTALKGVLDTTHPLAFGLDNRTYVLKFGGDALLPNKNWQAVGYFSKNENNLLASGYISKSNKQKLAGNAFAGVLSIGRGRVVLLMENMQYRMFWVNNARLMQNAIMLLPGK